MKKFGLYVVIVVLLYVDKNMVLRFLVVTNTVPQHFNLKENWH